MKWTRLAALIILPVYFFSCKPAQKLPSYLEHVNDTTGKGDVVIPDLRIQKNDNLSIQIISLSLSPEKSDAPFNLPSTGGAGAAEGGSGGYLVDNDGNIIHHRLGVIKAAGLTKNELAAEIRKRLTTPVELLKDPTVIIRINNFKVTVLGTVGREGIIQVPGERLTIFEAVGLAGGITDFGKKTNLKVVRELNGKRETGYIDLTSKEVFDSPYYYLMQNDMVFVEASSQKYKTEEQTRNIQRISFAFTLVTIAASIANIFIRN